MPKLGPLRRKMGKHFAWTFDEQTQAFSSVHQQEKIAAEEQLDGLYVIRTSLETEQLGDADVVRAHLFVCMLAHYLEWHLRQRLAPLLFAEEGGRPEAACPVSPAERSPTAKRKDRTRKTLEGGLPLQSFPDLLESLSTLTVVELEHEQLPGHANPALSAMTELLRLKPDPAPALSRPPEKSRT